MDAELGEGFSKLTAPEGLAPRGELDIIQCLRFVGDARRSDWLAMLEQCDVDSHRRAKDYVDVQIIGGRLIAERFIPRPQSRVALPEQQPLSE
jgi:hypothetical protein